MNSRWMVTLSGGRLSVIVMRPSPTRLLPDQAYTAPGPAGAPETSFFIAGSSFSHGDHSGHLRKSFTYSCTTAGGAAMIREREIVNSEGRVATYSASPTRIRTTTTAIVFNMGASGAAGHGAHHQKRLRARRPRPLAPRRRPRR